MILHNEEELRCDDIELLSTNTKEKTKKTKRRNNERLYNFQKGRKHRKTI